MKAANDNLARICPNCNAPVTGHAAKKYCCEACQREHHQANYVRPAEISQAYECEHCNQSFKPKRHDRTRFCSRECAFAKRKVEAEQRAEQPKPRKPNLVSDCTVCGSAFEHTMPGAMYCNPRCNAKAFAAANDNRDRSPRLCAECGTSFAPEYGNKRRNFCSLDCASRNARRRVKLKRKARMRTAEAEAVDPIQVFERDGWCCYMCGISTPRELRGTLAPNAPELEHIIPLSKGGAHSYGNTACACRACNARKSDKLLDAA